MLRKLLISAAAIAMTSPAFAVFNVTFNNAPVAIPVANDFKTQLAGFGLNSFATTGATVLLSSTSQIKFEFFGSESGYSDTFRALGVDGTLTKSENTSFTPWGAQLIGTKTFNAGSLAGLLNFSAVGLNAQNATIGQQGFGIFYSSNQRAPSLPINFSTNVLWFGYDDATTQGSDNHDDMIIRATIVAVPEPATWAMMVGGVGIAGMALRRRRRNASATAMA